MAAQEEGFFAAHPNLTERARALVTAPLVGDVRPWEHIIVPSEVDGTQGTFRAPRESCSLRANNDYEAVQTWLSMHEAPATQRAYRKEAERLMLWAIFERGLALSSLTTEDAAAYRAFLRHPAPRSRWVGPATERFSPLWRPFTGGLSPRSIAYALSVLGALFRWLIAKRYVLANLFAGVRVRGARSAGMDTTRGFSGGEWQLVRTVADALEWAYGWTPAAAQRMRFVLDFGFGTGLRASELVNAVLGNVEIDAGGDVWLHVVGKGSKPGMNPSNWMGVTWPQRPVQHGTVQAAGVTEATAGSYACDPRAAGLKPISSGSKTVEKLEAARSGAIEPSVCGGQTGADRAALDWAIVHGVPHGGWWPARRTAEDDAIPPHYQLVEMPDGGYRQRTKPGAHDSDATLVVSIEPVLTGGSRETMLLSGGWASPGCSCTRQWTGGRHCGHGSTPRPSRSSTSPAPTSATHRTSARSRSSCSMRWRG
jgi:site-specific recombinase XerD